MYGMTFIGLMLLPLLLIGLIYRDKDDAEPVEKDEAESEG